MSRNPQKYPRTLALIAFMTLLLGAGQASAGDSPWYVEARLGQADFDATLGTRWVKDFDDQDRAVGVELGYRFNRYFAVQVGYHDFGDFQGFGPPCAEDDEICVATIEGEPLVIQASELALCIEGAIDCPWVPLVITPLNAEVSGLSLAVVPSYPFNDRLSLFGKLGVLAWDADISEAFDGRRIDSFSDQELLAGIGLRYTFPSGFGISAEYEQIDLDLGSTRLGVSWRF